MIQTIEDRFEGVIVDTSTLPLNTNGFTQEIIQVIESSKSKKLIWIKIPVDKSEFIPILTRLNFEFHHCDEKNLMLCRKMTPDAFVPTTKNYIVGVGAIVIHEDKLLVVKDRFYPGYKLPGGHIDKNESIKDALKREVLEETGVSIEFESIMNIGHFKNGQFGESNLYMVCTAKATSQDISIHDSSEIAEAKWIDPKEFLNMEDVNNYNKSVVEAAITNKELKLTERQIKLRVAGGEVFF